MCFFVRNSITSISSRFFTSLHKNLGSFRLVKEKSCNMDLFQSSYSLNIFLSNNLMNLQLKWLIVCYLKIPSTHLLFWDSCDFLSLEPNFSQNFAEYHHCMKTSSIQIYVKIIFIKGIKSLEKFVHELMKSVEKILISIWKRFKIFTLWFFGPPKN